MFWQMVKGALMRQRGRFLLILLTVALGVSLATAMLSVMFDVGDKVNQELKAYGANIMVTPLGERVLTDLYGREAAGTHKEYLQEEDLGKIKNIFWANNIVAFAPSLSAEARLSDGTEVPVVGTWFSHTLTLPTGEAYTTGIKELKSWWQVEGAYPTDGAADEVLVGKKLAAAQGLSAGDTFSLHAADKEQTVRVSGIVAGGGEEETEIIGNLPLAQALGAAPGKVESVEVSAITTPENDLARKAAANPKSLSQHEYDIWYCTAYVGSIAYQLEEVLPGAAAHPVRQIAESEGKILDKTQLLMMLITVLSLVSSALGVSNLVSANVMERSRELGLLKALGASNLSVIVLVLTEIFLVGIVGGIVGYAAGIGFAQIIGRSVFGSGIAMNGFVIPMVALMLVLVLLVGSVPAIRTLLALRPAEVLHGR